MATEALLPFGAAYEGATQTLLDDVKTKAGASYYPTVYNPKTATKKGHATIGKTRTADKTGFKLYYEVHGSGPTHIVFVMGLNNSCFGWLPQVEHFSKQSDKYSCLVFDNRGVSNSDTPAGVYKTSEMALDTFELLQEVGWTEKRSIHLVGVSMGGMISLEMARQKSELLASLHLVSTTPGRRFRTPTYGLTSLVRVLGGRVFGFDNEAYRLNRLMTTLFPEPWLAEKSAKDPTRTNQQVIFDMFKWRFGFTKRQSVHGALAQIKAALTHNVPDADLARINNSVPKICIYTGDVDHLVDPRNSEYLSTHMSHAELHQFTNAGHALGNQLASKMNEILERAIAEAQDKVQQQH